MEKGFEVLYADGLLPDDDRLMLGENTTLSLRRKGLLLDSLAVTKDQSRRTYLNEW